MGFRSRFSEAMSRAQNAASEADQRTRDEEQSGDDAISQLEDRARSTNMSRRKFMKKAAAAATVAGLATLLATKEAQGMEALVNAVWKEEEGAGVQEEGERESGDREGMTVISRYGVDQLYQDQIEKQIEIHDVTEDEIDAHIREQMLSGEQLETASAVLVTLKSYAQYNQSWKESGDFSGSETHDVDLGAGLNPQNLLQSELGLEIDSQESDQDQQLEGLYAVGSVEYDTFGNPFITVEMRMDVLESAVAESEDSIVAIPFEVGATTAELSYLDRPEQEDRTYPPIREENNKYDDEGNVTVEIIYKHGDTFEEIDEAEYNRLLEEFNNKQGPQSVVMEERFWQTNVWSNYSGEDGYENYSKLLRIANNNEDKLVIANAGELYGHLNPVRLDEMNTQAESQEMLSENLFTVSTTVDIEDSEFPVAIGADIYVSHVDIENLGLTHSQENATKVISEITRSLVDLGVEQSDVKELLQALSANEGEEDNPFYILDFEQVREFVEEVHSRQESEQEGS